MSDYKRSTAKELGLKVYSFMCEQCEAENSRCFNNPYGVKADYFGAECKDCNTLVLFDLRGSEIFPLYPDEFSPVSEKFIPDADKRVRFHEKVIKNFLKALPFCPNCETGKYFRLVANHPGRDDDWLCRKCNSSFEGGGDCRTHQMQDMGVWELLNVP